MSSTNEEKISSEQRVLTQIAKRLHDIFDAHIDLSDVSSKKSDEIENYFLTRAYIALFFVDEIGLSPSAAAACITDAGDDDGIDAVYIDKKNEHIYLGQSKWRKDPNKGIALSEFTRFRDGVKDVIALNWNENNASLHRFRPGIEEQLSNINSDVRMVFAHTSIQELSEIISQKAGQFLEEENKYTPDFLSFREFRLREAAQAARSLTRPENISLSIMLAHWGMLPSPYKAV